MENKDSFKTFRSVLEAEVLDEDNMNRLEAAGNCDAGCKKSCKNGNQGGKQDIEIIVRPDGNDKSFKQC